MFLEVSKRGLLVRGRGEAGTEPVLTRSLTMTAITVSPTSTTAAVTRVPTWRSGLATGAVAAVVTTVVAVALRAAGVPLDIAGEEIPVLGFAQMVLLCTVGGIVLARHLKRTTFVATTVVLTVLSVIPGLTADTGTASKLGLMMTHAIAAAIVIPRLARPLSD
jgi:hypothetical protein